MQGSKPPSACEVWGTAICGALLFAASFPPIGLWWLAFVAPIPLVRLAYMPHRQRWIASFVAFFAAWLFLEQWVALVTAAGYPSLCLYLALWTPATLWLLARLRTRTNLPAAIILPLTLASMEWLRGRVVLDGYPWFFAGTPLIEWPLLAQGAEHLGAVWGTIIVGAVAGGISDVMFQSSERPLEWRRGVLIAAALVQVCLAIGFWEEAKLKRETSTLRVLAVQTNLRTDNKIGWRPVDQERDVSHFIDMTIRAAVEARQAGTPAQVVVWPETMLPGFGLEPEALQTLNSGGWWPGDRFANAAINLQQSLGVPLIVGSPAYLGLTERDGNWEWSEHFNSAYLIDDGLVRARADKLFLTPFGETMPYISNWDWLESTLLDFGAKGMKFDLDTGAQPVRLQVGGIRVATPICFEDTVAEVCRSMCFQNAQRAADVMINLSNDGWFGAFDAGRAQHQQVARWRCIELRTPMVRVVNTGTSSCTDAWGRESTIAPPRTETCMLTQVSISDQVPLFARIGDVTSPLMALSCAILGFRRRARMSLQLLIPLCLVLTLTGCSWRRQGQTTKPTPAPQNASKSQLPNSIAGTEWSTRERSLQPLAPTALAATREAPLDAPTTLGEDDLAIDLLRQAATGSDELLRAHALEALAVRPELFTLIVPRSLGSPNRGVRFVAAMASGRAANPKLIPLVEPLLLDPDPSVRAAAIFALTRMGRKVDQSPLAAMVLGSDPTQRANAFIILGELGNPSAIVLIREGMRRPIATPDPIRSKIVELQGAEALFKLGDQSQGDPIRAALLAPAEHAELIALGCQIAGEVGDRESAGILNNILEASGSLARPVEIRLAAAAALAKLGSGPLLQVYEFASSAATDRDPMIRAQAAATLGSLGGPQAAARLSPLLRDQSPLVQVAAAAGLLRAGTKSTASAASR